MAAPLIGDEQNFEREVLHSPLPVLVDFWGPN
jgi:thioredoxin-like negative regulator of GroEL